jgi:MYXO-CTERM domain-containing protein
VRSIPSLTRRLAGFALAAIGTTAGAVPLAPGSVVAGPAGVTAAAQPQLAGTIVEDVTTPFSYRGWLTDSSDEPVTFYGNVTGTVQSRVVQSIDHTYDFYWRISVDDGAFLPLLDFTVQGLSPASYQADWRHDGPGSVQPALITQSLSGDVQFVFGSFIDGSTQVFPGEQSRFVFLDSSARGYTGGASFQLASGRDTGGSMMIQWGGASGFHPTFMPTPVPEPSAAWLALCGLGVLAAWSRRQRR